MPYPPAIQDQGPLPDGVFAQVTDAKVELSPSGPPCAILDLELSDLEGKVRQDDPARLALSLPAAVRLSHALRGIVRLTGSDR